MRALLLSALTVLTAASGLAQPALFAPTLDGRLALTPRQAELLAAFESEPGTGTVELVTANASLLGEVPAVSVGLPSGPTIALETAAVTRRQADDLSWSGRTALSTARGGEAALVARHGWLTGTIWNDGITYVVRPLTGGLHAIAVFDATGLQEHPDDYEESLDNTPDEEQPIPRQKGSDQGSSEAQNTIGGVLVDVLVVYTADLVTNSADPVAFSQSAIDATNASYANSGISTRIRMVYAHQTPDASTPSTNPTTSSGRDSPDLSDLTGTSDGQFDEVHGIRDAYGADMVALIGPSSSTYGYCGVAYLDASATGVFSLTARNCAVGNLSFAHELGHNFGAQHNAGNGNGAYSYGFGTIAEPTATEGSWRSVMAYNDCETGPCTRLPQWSNPDVIVRGTASGDATSRDNARVMDERGPIVGAFRAPSAGPPVLAYTPNSMAVTVSANGMDSSGLSIQNTAAAGRADLAWEVDFANVQVPGTPPPNACSGTQLLSQPSRTNVQSVSSGYNMGQSFQALCTGALARVSPKIYALSTPNTAWSGTLFVYDGEGTDGTQLAAVPVSVADNGTDEYYLDIDLPSPLEVVAGQSYTWFLQVTSGVSSLTYANANAYAGGQRYTSTSGAPGDAAVVSDTDMEFQATFKPSTGWISAAPASGVVPAGGSVASTVSFDATGLPVGVYTADLILTSNDAGNLTNTLQVTLSVTGGGIALADGTGWRLLAAPSDGVTVGGLAGENLVQGTTDQYPDATTVLYTQYDGSAWVPAGADAQALPSGTGFAWYLFDNDLAPPSGASGGGTSQSAALPMMISTAGTEPSADVSAPLHGDGDGWNLLGNPFARTLDMSGLASWIGAGNLATTVGSVWVCEPNAATPVECVGSYLLTSHPDLNDAVPAGSAVFVQASAAGTLTIPSAAGASTRQSTRSLVAFELASADGAARDRAAMLVFDAGADDGWDGLDVEKLATLAAPSVELAFTADRDGERVLKAQESRALDTRSFEIPMSVASRDAGAALVLTWPHLQALPDDWSFALTDRETGTTVDLRVAERYAFEVVPQAGRQSQQGLAAAASQTDGEARFTLSVTTSRSVDSEDGADAVLSLSVPSPNPVRGRASVAYSLAQPGAARLTVVDLLGREVAVLLDGEHTAGPGRAVIETSDLSAGVYLIRLTTGADVRTQRVVVVR